jgi:hypothetical protein
VGGDYSALDTREKAWSAVEREEIVAILMVPEDFGGTECDENIVFVPPAVAERKRRIEVDIVMPIIRSRPPVEYQVIPENDRRSMVPIALNIRAWQASSLDSTMCRLEIWAGSIDSSTA